MTLQVLVSTMNQTDFSLLDKMNIQSDAIVINQCNKNEIIEFKYRDNNIKWISLNERGVGLSRNTALMRSTADIVLFADDDIVYEDNYHKKILLLFEKNPKTDVLIFNIDAINSERPEYIIQKNKKLNLFNCLRYGAVRIAARRLSLEKRNIFFSLLFGGGAKYSAGEDNIFITECIKKKLLVEQHPYTLGRVDNYKSSWFLGYTEQYFKDKGVLLSTIYGRWAYLLSLYIIIKNFNTYKKTMKLVNSIKFTFQGIAESK